MVKFDLGGCSSFVKEGDYKEYVDKALQAFDVLESETGAGNDFLGWKTLPVDIPESLIQEFEAIQADPAAPSRPSRTISPGSSASPAMPPRSSSQATIFPKSTSASSWT